MSALKKGRASLARRKAFKVFGLYQEIDRDEDRKYSKMCLLINLITVFDKTIPLKKRIETIYDYEDQYGGFL